MQQALGIRQAASWQVACRPLEAGRATCVAGSATPSNRPMGQPRPQLISSTIRAGHSSSCHLLGVSHHSRVVARAQPEVQESDTATGSNGSSPPPPTPDGDHNKDQLHTGRAVGSAPVELPSSNSSSSSDSSTSTPTSSSTNNNGESNGSSSSSSSSASNSANGTPSAPPPAAPKTVAYSSMADDTAQDARIKKAISGLDALLGLTDEPVKDAKKDGAAPGSKWRANTGGGTAGAGISASKEALDKLAEAEAARAAARGEKPPPKDKIEEQFVRIIDKARKLADEQSSPAGNVEAEQAKLRQEFETLLQAVSKGPSVLDKDELKKLKEAAFGPLTFWVTETTPFQEPDRAGILIRGNLRDERAKVFDLVRSRVKELFAGKYEVMMVEDTNEAGADDGPMAGSAPGSTPRRDIGGAANLVARGPRIAFQIIPAEQATPPPTNAWKAGAAFVLSILFVGACVQLALVANVAKLPKETLAFFANSDNLSSDVVPPGLENWDPSSYFATAAPIIGGLLALNTAHELGHRVAAATRGVKLGPSYFVPNLQIGSFSAITPFASLLKGREDLWDIAAAGPVAGILTSALLLAVGLAQSHPATAAAADAVGADGGAAAAGAINSALLVPVPSALFQGSLLLGSIARLALGEAALRAPEVQISPLVIAGWCGLLANALNLLPVGQLDGGRMVQAAYGRQALSLSSFFTYVGLGLGLLGSSLALPFGLYIIICQRAAERYVQDSVTPAGDARQAATAVAVLASILILLPMAPEIADSFGVGPSNPFL